MARSLRDDPRQSSQSDETIIPLDSNGHVTFSMDDPDNPKNWSLHQKCYLTGVAILMVMNATFASSAPTGALEGIMQDFGVSIEVAGLVITVFLLGYCFGPLFWAPLSEFYGRRWIFLISFTAYIAFGFLCAFAPSFSALLIGRFLTGSFAACALTNAPGLISDIWEADGRGNAMILFSVMTFVGPALGPVISGFLYLTKTWRWTFYVLLWLSAFTMLLLVTIPETLPDQVLKKKATRIRQQNIEGFEQVYCPIEVSDRRLSLIFRTALIRPWIILFDPISFFVAIYYSLVYTLLYMLFSIYPIIFQQKRGWNPGVGELPLIGTIIGACVGGLALYAFSWWETKRHTNGHISVPEDRLKASVAGGILFALSMFWFAWTAEFDSVPWIVPTIAGGVLASSILLIFVSYINYIIDSYLMYAASAIAANTIVRSACGSAAQVFTQYMFNALGVGGGGSLIGGLAILLAPIPFVFYRYGSRIRARSKFAPDNELSQNRAQEKETEV